MRVIFQADVKGVANKGEVKEVKDGYARNYLVPKGLAVEATSGRERALNDRKRREQQKVHDEREAMRTLADALKDTIVTVYAKVGEQDRLFGAVTNADVASALNKLGHVVDRKKIEMDPIKHVGEHRAVLHLYAGISTEIMVKVEAEF